MLTRLASGDGRAGARNKVSPGLKSELVNCSGVEVCNSSRVDKLRPSHTSVELEYKHLGDQHSDGLRAHLSKGNQIDSKEEFGTTEGTLAAGLSDRRIRKRLSNYLAEESQSGMNGVIDEYSSNSEQEDSNESSIIEEFKASMNQRPAEHEFIPAEDKTVSISIANSIAELSKLHVHNPCANELYVLGEPLTRICKFVSNPLRRVRLLSPTDSPSEGITESIRVKDDSSVLLSIETNRKLEFLGS